MRCGTPSPSGWWMQGSRWGASRSCWGTAGWRRLWFIRSRAGRIWRGLWRENECMAINQGATGCWREDQIRCFAAKRTAEETTEKPEETTVFRAQGESKAGGIWLAQQWIVRSEEHTSEL